MDTYRAIAEIWGLFSSTNPAVEGLYCKRPIQCLASSEVLTPPSPHRPWGGHTRLVEKWWGVNSSEDAGHCSVLYLCT